MSGLRLSGHFAIPILSFRFFLRVERNECEKVKLVKVKMGTESTFLLHSHTSEKSHAKTCESVECAKGYVP